MNLHALAHLGIQLGGVLSTSHVANSFIGTGLLTPDADEDEKAAAAAAAAGIPPPARTPPAPAAAAAAVEAAAAC